MAVTIPISASVRFALICTGDTTKVKLSSPNNGLGKINLSSVIFTVMNSNPAF